MIGILGFGRFGALAARHLSEDFPVKVWDRSRKAEAIAAAGAQPVDFATACGQPYILICVPISKMISTLKEMAPKLASDAVVMDVCSVKTLPAQWMHDHLPGTVSILPTHPMFGPDSAAHHLAGRKIVLCPQRIGDHRFRKIVSYLEGKSLQVIDISAEEHDRQIAVSLALTHFIGRSLARFGAPELAVDTEGYMRLRHILGVVKNDTWQLFEDMNRFNPFAEDARHRFLAAAAEINGLLDSDPNTKLPAKHAAKP